jgi:hypothetical protein
MKKRPCARIGMVDECNRAGKRGPFALREIVRENGPCRLGVHAVLTITYVPRYILEPIFA